MLHLDFLNFETCLIFRAATLRHGIAPLTAEILKSTFFRLIELTSISDTPLQAEVHNPRKTTLLINQASDRIVKLYRLGTINMLSIHLQLHACHMQARRIVGFTTVTHTFPSRIEFRECPSWELNGRASFKAWRREGGRAMVPCQRGI